MVFDGFQCDDVAIFDWSLHVVCITDIAHGHEEIRWKAYTVWAIQPGTMGAHHQHHLLDILFHPYHLYRSTPLSTCDSGKHELFQCGLRVVVIDKLGSMAYLWEKGIQRSC